MTPEVPPIKDPVPPAQFLWQAVNQAGPVQFEATPNGAYYVMQIFVAEPYFQSETPIMYRSDKTYAGGDVTIQNEASAEWAHPLSEIVTAILDAGLTFEFLHEHDRLAWQFLPSLELREDGMWHLPAGRPQIPLALSIKARRHA